MINILLVDDHQVVLDGLKFYFENSKKYRIKDTASNGLEVLSILEKKSFDLIITDISMPKMNGMEWVEAVRAKDKDQKILIMTMMGEIQHIKKLLALGVNGYLLKNSKQSELFNAIDEIMLGERYFSEEVTKNIMSDLMGKKLSPKTRLTVEVPLTDREKEVLSLIVEECSNQEIADSLFISLRTVDSHKRNLLEKTGAKNIAGLVLYAVERNMVPQYS